MAVRRPDGDHAFVGCCFPLRSVLAIGCGERFGWRWILRCGHGLGLGERRRLGQVAKAGDDEGENHRLGAERTLGEGRMDQGYTRRAFL